MRTFSLVIVSLCSCLTIIAQPPQAQSYTLDNIHLPAELNKQVCISGMKYYNGQLYFASERCPKIIVFDPIKEVISSTIDIQVPQNFEMEGMTSYKDKLYVVSESVAAVYEVTIATGAVKNIQTSITLPAKSKYGDGMEGIAANEKNNKFYLLRERDDNMSHSQIYTFTVEAGKEGSSISLKNESMIELQLENPQWRYSDICVDIENSRLLCLKSYAKGKFRQQYLESMTIDANGKLLPETLKNIPVENFTDASNAYKTQDYSMNLEGVTIDNNGTIYIISDNTSGKANCDIVAKEKTILLQLKKK
ncbi:MAG: esterase-like activity of phytase family protein [Bacteroidota bacterium]|nr:esterase-like activity of phytase family protein [Bacteroidota bacterium]